MALDGSYAGLLASIADHLSRTDLTATIPDFVVIAESDMNRKLRTRLMQTQVTASVSSEFVTVPSDFAGLISMQNSLGQPLNERDPDAFALLAYQNGTTAGSISDFTIYGGAFGFYPAPSSAVSVTMTYYQRLPALASNTAGNWLSLAHPDAYLYGACTAAAPYLGADERVASWGALYTRAIESLISADAERYSARLTPQPSTTSIV